MQQTTHVSHDVNAGLDCCTKFPLYPQNGHIRSKQTNIAHISWSNCVWKTLFDGNLINHVIAVIRQLHKMYDRKRKSGINWRLKSKLSLCLSLNSRLKSRLLFEILVLGKSLSKTWLRPLSAMLSVNGQRSVCLFTLSADILNIYCKQLDNWTEIWTNVLCVWYLN